MAEIPNSIISYGSKIFKALYTTWITIFFTYFKCSINQNPVFLKNGTVKYLENKFFHKV